MSPLDTPARAARARRPQTRNWRRLLEDAASKSETAAKHRALLRHHLEAAADLASRRRVIPLAAHQILADDSATWEQRLKALKSVAENPESSDIRTVAQQLPKDIADLRSMLVMQAAETVVAVRGLLNDDEAAVLFGAAAAGVAITKKVMADSRRRAALAVVETRTDQEFWDAVLEKIGGDQPATRKLVVDAVNNFAQSEDEEVVRPSVQKVLSMAAPDRSADVREAAKKLFRGYSVKHGEAAAKALVASLPRDAQDRLVVKKKVSEKKSVKQMMKERREALKRGKRAAEEPKTGDAKRIAVNDQENRENAELAA